MKDNIDFVDEVIKCISKKLNTNNINFYIVGAIGGYIDAKIPLQRKHDDLDIMVEEKDVDKLKEIFINTDFDFIDNRFVSDKVLNEYGYTDGDHEVYANHKYSDFHIGFFLFRVEKEKYTIIEYFRENGEQKILERSLPIEIFKYQYNDEGVYSGIKVKVARKELIYKNKKVMNREKDRFDIDKLGNTLNYEILNKLKGLSKLRKSNIKKIKE